MQPLDWTNSQTRAWQYIESAIDSGTNASTALRDYRAGGGAIRTQDFYVAYNRLSTSSESWGTLAYMHDFDTLPESMFSASPMKYQNNYVASFKTSIVDRFTGQSKVMYRQVGFDNRLTKDELYNQMIDSLKEDKSSPATSVNYITELHFFKRVGT